MSPAATRRARSRPQVKRQRIEEDDEPEHKDVVLINILKAEKESLANENEALKQRLKEAQNATSLETKEKNALKARNIKLKASWDSATQNVQSLRSQLGEANAAKKECRIALAKALSPNYSPMAHLAKNSDCQIMVKIEDHGQVMEDIVPLVSSGDQEHINQLLDFVFLGVTEKWFCFSAVCEKKVTDQDSFMKDQQCPVHKSPCELWLKKTKGPPQDRIVFTSTV
ncbi:hypothetical protein FVEG_04489 [Fusarium verticillioides 7600]|uniref:Uncharacterized protein n=1 Tax=Gibberella moniliformis (strain M3125 / FGSC 7600) TaxID=334819 RepID=W7LU50_GIBM7|nr:hypothetical protein FVEG_04489 [Fusarium verticillioides 7600]EWG42748.1 hypothetical protein FVEG_04489 [Fusarium verticillioides 7600]